MVSCRCSSKPWNSTTQPMTPKIADDPSRNHHFPQFKSQVPLPPVDCSSSSNVSSFATLTVVTPLGTLTLGSLTGGACHSRIRSNRNAGNGPTVIWEWVNWSTSKTNTSNILVYFSVNAIDLSVLVSLWYLILTHTHLTNRPKISKI